jgi:hypothetical protein
MGESPIAFRTDLALGATDRAVRLKNLPAVCQTFKTFWYAVASNPSLDRRPQQGRKVGRQRLALHARWCMCGRPLGCKRKRENSDGWVDCDHVSGLIDAAP